MASIFDPLQSQPIATPQPGMPDPLAPTPEQAITSEQAALSDPYFSRGLRSALAGGVGGAASYLGAEFDSPGLEKWGAEKQRYAGAVAPPGVDLDEVKDIPSGIRFASGLSGQAIGGILPTLVGGAGGVIAGLRAARMIGAGVKASRVLGATGAYTGAYGTAYPLEAGETFSSLEEAGIDRPTALRQARKKGVVNAALEAVVPTLVVNRFARAILGHRRIPTAMLGESATEFSQEASGQIFRAEVDPSFRMDDPARGKERITALLTGLIGGGAITAPTVFSGAGRAIRDVTGEGVEVGKRLVDRFKKSTAGEVTAETADAAANAVTNMALQADQLMEQAKASATPEAAEELMEQAKALGIATQAGIGEWIERVRADPRSQGTADMQVLSSMLAERGISRESAREVVKSGLGYLRGAATDGREYARGLLTAASSPEFVEESGTIETDARKNEIRDWLRGAGDALVPPEISADIQTTVEYLKTTAPQVKAAQASAWFRELDDDLQARVLQGIGKNFTNPKLQSRVAFASRVQELRDDDTRLTAIADRVMEGIKGKNLSLEPTQRDVTFAQKLRRAIQSNRRIDLQSEDAQRHIEHIIDNVVAISRSPAYQYWNVNKEASGPTAGIAELDGLSRAEITRILDRVLPTDISPDLALLLKRFGLIETGLKEFAQPEALEVTTKIVAKYMQQAGTTELIEPHLRTLRNGTTIDDGQTALETISRTVMRIALDHGYSVTSSRAEMERTLRNLSVAFNGDTAIMEAAVTETAQALEAQLPYGIAGEAITEVMAGQELEIGRQAAATAGQYTREEQVALGLEDEDAQATAPSLPEGWQVQAVAKPRIYHPPSTWVDISSPQARQNADAYLADVVQQLEHELGGPWTPQGDNDVHPVSFVSLPSYALTKAGNSVNKLERERDALWGVEAKYDATIQELIDGIKKANLDPGASLPAALQGNETFEAMRKGVRKQVDFLAKVRDADLKTKFEFLKQYAVVQAELVNPEAEVFSKKQRDYMQSIKSNDDFIPITLPSERLRTVEGKTVKPGFGIMRINPMRVTFAVFSDKNLSDQLPQADSDVARAYFAFTKGLGMLMVQMPVQNDMALFGFPADKPIPEIKTFTKLEFNFDEARFAEQKGLQGFLNLISPEGGGQPTPGWYRSPQADILVSPGFVRVVDKTVVKGGKKSRSQKFIREYTTVRPDLRIYARQGEVFRFAQAKIAANDVQRVGAPGIGTQIAEDALARATDAFYERQILSSVQYESETSYEGATAEMEVARDQLLTLERSTLVELSNMALRADQLIEQAKASATPEAADQLMKQAKALEITTQIVDRTLKGVAAALTKIESGIEALNEGVNIFSDRAQYAQGEWTSPETRPTPGTEEAAGEVFEIAVQERKRRNRAVRRFEEDLSLFSAGQKSPIVGKEGRFRRTAGSFSTEAAELVAEAERAKGKKRPEIAKALLARVDEVLNFRDRATEPVEHRPGTVYETKKERTAAIANLKKRLERAQKEVDSIKDRTDKRKATSRIAAMKLELRDAESAVIVARPKQKVTPVKRAQPAEDTGLRAPPPPRLVPPRSRTTALFSVVAGKIADLTGMSVEDARIAAQYTQPLAARYGLTQIQDDRDAGKITPEQATLQTTAYLGKRGLRFDKKQWDENKVIKLAIANRALGVPFAVGERRQPAPSTRGPKQPEVKPVAKRIQRVATPAPEVVRAAPKPTRFAESPENFIAAKKAINARLKALQAERKEKGGKREATPVEELFRTLAELNYGKLNKQQRTVYAAMGTALSRPDPDLAAIEEAGTKSGVLTTHAEAVSANAPKRAGTTRHFYYAGVGSRETPSKVLRQMTQLSEQLEKAGFHLRSGNAIGADQAFETGVTDEASKTSYLSRHATPEAIKFASKLHPAWPAVLAAGKGIDKLLGRNVFQVLGKDFTDASNASDFVVYYDNPLKRGGGTKMAVAIAEAKNIPAFNLFYGDPAVKALRTWLVKNYPANLKKKGVGGALTGVMPKGHAIPVSDLNRPAVKPPTDAEIAAARTRMQGPAQKPKNAIRPETTPAGETPTVPMYYQMPPEGIRKDLRARYPKGTTTARMIRDGVRTATTRKPFGKVGMRFRIQTLPGVFEITELRKVNFDTIAGRNAWAQLEGWDPTYVQKNLSRQVYTGATQTMFKRVDEGGPKTTPPKSPTRKPKPVAQELASSPTAAISLEAEPRTDLDSTEAATLDDLIKQQKNFNLEPPKKGRRKKLAPTQKEVVDLAKKLLDKDITVEWMNTDWEIVIDGKKYKPSGQFAEANGHEILRVSATAKDPLLKVHHEAMHGLLSRMMKDPDTRPVVDKLVKAVSTPQVLKQLREVLPAEARAQLGDPLERVAYAYQYWTVNKVAFGPTAKNLFQTIADLLRRLVRAMANHEVAEVVFDAFNKGELASKELLAMRLRAKLTRSYVDKAGEILKPLVDVYEKLIATSDARMRATGVLALAELADMFKPEVGSQNKRLGFIQKKFAVGNQWLNEFADILTGTSEEDRLKAVELLHAQADNAGPLGNKVREFLDKAFDYIEASGVERYFGWNKKGNVAEWGKVLKRAKFFPMVFDKEAVYKDHEPFVKMLVDNNVNRRKAEEIWTAISRKTAIVGVEDGEFGNLNEDGVAYTPLFSSLEPRTLNQLHKDPRFLKYADKDLMGVMSRYIHQMVARAEYTKRFGNEGRGILDKLDEAKKQGATPEQIAAAMNYVRAMEGTYGREQDPELRKWTSTLIVYQNVRLLGMALFSSFVDPLGLWVRGASFTEATKAFIQGITDVFRSQDSIIKEHSNEIAELVGTIDRTSMLESMGQMYGSNYLSPWQRKVNDFMFWVNGMNAWNTSMRTSATLASMKFIKLHAERAKTGDDTSIRYMNELNLKPKDVKLAADGEIDVRDEKIQEAIHLWVDDAVLRPTAADRPIWASDPVFAIFFHLKQYIYSFQKHIMGRAFLEAQNGNLIPVAALGAYIPVMLASDITRGLIQGLGDQPSYRQGWTAGDWLSNSIQRSGLTGISQFAIDTATDLDYGGLGYESILGPSVSQFTKGVNVVLGEGNAGSFAVAALPGSSWYKNW